MRTEDSNFGRLMDFCLWHEDLSKCSENLLLREKKSKRASFPEKSYKFERDESVPKTDTGGLALECLGERVKAPEGTRQNSGRNFGIRPAYVK